MLLRAPLCFTLYPLWLSSKFNHKGREEFYKGD